MNYQLASVRIVPLNPSHQEDISRFMTTIATEFTEPITTVETKKITDLALLPTDKYWVATAEGKAVGTVGLTTIANHTIVLKRVFLAKEYRGQGVATALLDTVLDWANNQCIKRIYLGTMAQFKAAQKFYEKNGFTKISGQDLPIDFPRFHLDSVFYQKILE